MPTAAQRYTLLVRLLPRNVPFLAPRLWAGGCHAAGWLNLVDEYWEGNMAADALAKEGHRGRHTQVWIGEPPTCIREALFGDLVGRATPGCVA